MGEIFMELSQSKMKISMLAIFEEIKDKTENCGKEFETNEKKSHMETLEVENKTSEMNSVAEYDSMLYRAEEKNQ